MARIDRTRIVIREMRPEDARAFLETHHAAVRGVAANDYPPAVIEAWAPAQVYESAVRRVRANPEREYRLVAEIGGRVVGIAAALFERAELRACYVSPEAGRNGVGSALVRAIERAAYESGATRLRLDSSLTAESFYRKAGYETIGRGEHILDGGQAMACVMMAKTLSPPG